MKRLLFFVFLSVSFSCSKGELQITGIDFEDASLQYCGTADIDNRLFFKLNDREALILELAPGLLRNETSTSPIESTIPSASKLSYRIFNDGVGSNYFCDLVPPSKPGVLEDIQAAVGLVRIETTQSSENPSTFEHNISLQGVSFVNSKGERLTNLSVEQFGVYKTTQE